LAFRSVAGTPIGGLDSPAIGCADERVRFGVTFDPNGFFSRDRLPMDSKSLVSRSAKNFVDDRLGKIRVPKQELESRLADLERVDYRPVNLEAATRDALTYLARFCDVLEEKALSNSGRSSCAASCTKSASIPTRPRTIDLCKLPAGS
jgi:hypothetical protein